ncbi:MAG TPA: aldo/keto reductase [Armatimonadaceae bacterium]|nr:aldo/keto reductase [Armatimonadaceae bacterium]
MRYRTLGRTGLSLSVLGFGASPLGGVFGPVDADEAARAVRLALDRGVNYFDVSPYYGDTRAETVLGQALRGVPRDRYVLSTKVGRYGGRAFDFSPERVVRSVDESLARLGVGHADILLCHDVEFVPLGPVIEETIPALRERVVAAGKARFLGVSGLPLAIFPAVLERADLDVVLSYCHYTLSDTSLDTLLPYLDAREVGVINAAPLGMGLLTGQPPPEWHPAPPALRGACERAAAHCRARGADLAELAVGFSVARPDITTTLVGMATTADVNRNIDAAERAPDPNLLAEVREILRPVRDLSWPNGLPENDPLYAGREG